MSLPNDESVNYDVRINAVQAIQDLRQLALEADKVHKKLAPLGKGPGGSFGDIWKKMSEDAKKATADVAKVGPAAQKSGQEMQSGFSRAISTINILRIALGALVSMLLFNVIQAFGAMAQGALKGLSEIEAAMFNIVNAEKRLSDQGVDISVGGLEKLIEDLRVLNPMLSKFQATELISTLATKVAPSFGFGTEQIERMAKSVTVLAVRNQALGKSFEEVQQQFITGILSGRVTQGINQLGTKLTDQIVKENAVATGLVRTAEAYDKLAAKEQERINVLSIMSILEKETAEEAGNIPTFLQTASGMIGIVKAQFQDILTSIGQKFAPVLKEVLKIVIGFLETLNRSLVENAEAWDTLVTISTAVVRVIGVIATAFLDLAMMIGKAGAALYGFLSAIPVVGNAVKALFPDAGYADTPTAPGMGGGAVTAEAQKYGEEYAQAVAEAEDKVSDLMKEARDKRLDIERDYQRKLQDIARNYAQKLEDIARNTAQKVEDANRNYGQKIEDINRDANQKIAEAQEDARNKELDAEEEFQRKLAELRQRFLFDLEDALHERDARQVLRLIREYNFDKKNLEDKRKLEREESQLSLQHKLENIEIERQQKLEAAKREHEERLAEIALYAQRERQDAAIANRRALADARLDHQRKLAENREYLKRKLQDIAEAVAKEFQLTAAGAQAISSLLGGYFGAGGVVGQIFNGLQNSLTGMTQVAGSGAVSGDGSYQGYGYSGYGYSGYGAGFAEGGTLIATRPTKAVFGEKGPEKVSFTPLGRSGRNTSQVFGDKSAAGMGGSIALEVSLSPDLEARIIDSSLEGVAIHLEKIARTK